MVDHVIESLSLSDDHLMRLSSKMSQELVRGLHQSTNDEAEIKMLPSFVTSTPDGSENGEFLALDLGGTNFRIILVKIQSGDSPKIQMDNQVYAISNELMTGTGTQLFDHMVNCLWDFLVERGMMCQLLPIGFTFSFPTKNLGIKQTILVNWSKGFTATGVVGEDIGQLLNDAINRKFKIRCLNFELKIMATVVNDTVGTLVSCAFDHHDTCMGLIVGTGTNMCYMEAQSNIELLNNHKTLEGEMCINTEWGAFGDNSGALDEIKTSYDIDIDRNSPNVGQHIFEKMISGMYMGELARLIIVDLSNKGHLFQSIDSNSLFYKSGFSTAFVSQILQPHFTNEMMQEYLRGYGVTCSDEDMTKLRKICESLSIRAASLCAIGVIAVARKIIEHRGQRHLVVGVDGSVYRKHPTFKSLLINTTHRLAPELNIDFQLSTDGSGRGAALVAAVESRIQHIVTQ